MSYLRRFVVVAGLVVVASAFAQMYPQRDFIVAGKDVFMMLPQEFICGPTIKEISWSPDGDKLVAVREFADVSPAMYSDMILNREVDRATLEPEI